jgi:LysM repeat protein
MKRCLHLVIIAAAGSLASGCATLFEDPAVAQQQRREDMALVDEKIRRIEGRIETMELELNRIQQQVDALPRSAGNDIMQLQTSINDLNRKIQQVDAARERDKQEIVDTLSRKVATIVSKSGGSSSPPKKSSTRATSGTGYEHVVESGQTLSAIASAYGVKQADIIQANDLKEPYLLRVGQKLFIPSP